jgi:hypothetical protein
MVSCSTNMPKLGTILGRCYSLLLFWTTCCDISRAKAGRRSGRARGDSRCWLVFYAVLPLLAEFAYWTRIVPGLNHERVCISAHARVFGPGFSIPYGFFIARLLLSFFAILRVSSRGRVLPPQYRPRRYWRPLLRCPKAWIAFLFGRFQTSTLAPCSARNLISDSRSL